MAIVIAELGMHSRVCEWVQVSSSSRKILNFGVESFPSAQMIEYGTLELVKIGQKLVIIQIYCSFGVTSAILAISKIPCIG